MIRKLENPALLIEGRGWPDVPSERISFHRNHPAPINDIYQQQQAVSAVSITFDELYVIHESNSIRYLGRIRNRWWFTNPGQEINQEEAEKITKPTTD